MALLSSAKGLITLQSEIARQEGALSVADNVVIDADNVIEQRRGYSEFGSVIPGSVNAKQLMVYKGRILRHYSNVLAYDSNGAGSFTAFSGTYEELETKLRIKYVESNGNLYFTTNAGIRKISATMASEFTNASGYITNAGGVKAIDVEAKLKPDVSGWLPAQSKVAYRVVWGIKDKNSNLVLGSPSARYVLTNTSEDINVGERFTANVLSNTLGDYINTTFGRYFQFSITDNTYTVWFDTTGSIVAPTDSGVINTTLIKVTLTGLTTTDQIAAKIAQEIIASAGTYVDVSVVSSEITITNKTGGDVTNADQGTILAADVLISTVYDGQVSSGTPANADVTFSVPQDIDNTLYFYQIYRTAYVTVGTGQILNDIDPGEEFQLVYESGITSAEISAGVVVVEDITPESFREGGAFLYTNPVSGAGITQANERPPIAKDIALFKNSVFFANTKELHRLQINLLSTVDFVSGTSKFFVGNSDIIREYTFKGVTEVTDITVQPKSTTVGNSYIIINSANDERNYMVWFDKGTISKAITTATPGTDTLEVATGHGFADNDVVVASGTLPTGLPAGTYFVRDRTATTFKLALTAGGVAVDFSGTGTGGIITHTPAKPTVADSLEVRVALQIYADTAQGSKDALLEALFDFSDFSAEDYSASVVRISCTNNGNVTNPSASSPASAWTTNVVTQGDGEDAGAYEVFLSGLSSAAQSVDETARSLVKVINADSDSPVNAFYLSGPTDLPGIILFENRSLLDDPFYLAASPAAIQAAFNAELALRVNLDSINDTTDVFTTSSAHGLIAGDEVYIHDNPNGAPTEFGGKYTVATAPTTTTFTLTGVDVQTLQASPLNGSVFKTTNVSDNSVNPNRIYFSKVNQPEAVPLVNYFDVGSKDQAIERIVALRDSLLVLKTDGVYIVSGPVAPNFSVRLVDGTANIIAPDSARALNNQVYMLSTQGVVAVTETGVSIISRNIENKILEVANAKFNFRLTTFSLAYESDRSYLLWLPTKSTDTVATQCYRYNTFTRTWTRWTKSNTCGVINPANDKMYLGSGTSRYYVEEERKNFERQDYADRNFTLSFGTEAIDGTTFTISSTSEVEEGDVIVQTQYATIPKFNRLLKKLDRDTSSFLSSDYFSTLELSAGANMSQALTALAAKLNIDLAAVPYTITTPSGVNTLAALQTDYNLIITELNNSLSGTQLKDYKQVTDLLTYEVLVESVNSTSEISVNFSTWFIEGDFQIYKAIKTEVEYAPQHFGKPEATKQVSEGTFIFDQNNFYGGIVGYCSDRSADFAEYTFTQRGPGFWISYPWADIVWGGNGNEVPVRTLVPQNKQRCRFLKIKYKHHNAREKWRLLGVSLEPREVSTRGYR